MEDQAPPISRAACAGASQPGTEHSVAPQPGTHATSQPIAADDNDAEGSDDQNDAGADVSFDKVEACTSSTNSADDYAHRGRKLSAMPYYVFRMYVTRVAKPHAKTCAPHTIFFEEHYALAKTYAQQVMLHRVDVPTILGFQCPSAQRDAEQLCTPCPTPQRSSACRWRFPQ